MNHNPLGTFHWLFQQFFSGRDRLRIRWLIFQGLHQKIDDMNRIQVKRPRAINYVPPHQFNCRAVTSIHVTTWVQGKPSIRIPKSSSYKCSTYICFWLIFEFVDAFFQLNRWRIDTDWRHHALITKKENCPRKVGHPVQDRDIRSTTVLLWQDAREDSSKLWVKKRIVQIEKNGLEKWWISFNFNG